MEQNKVSIIIPIYNCEKYLEKCIESILCQTYRKFELILINDGSTDNSMHICQYYEKKDCRIILLNQENKGASSARNLGMHYASGEYILFIDSDDWIDANLLHDVVKKMKEYDVDSVVFGWQCEGDDNSVYKLTESDLILSGNDLINAIIDNDNIFGGGFTFNRLWKKDIIDNSKAQFDESLYSYEDKLFAICNYINSDRVLISPEIYYHYLVRQGSLSHNSELKWDIMDNTLEAYQKILFIVSSDLSIAKIATEKYYAIVMQFLASSLKRNNLQYAKKMYQILEATKNYKIAFQFRNWSILEKIKYFFIYFVICKFCLKKQKSKICNI